MKPEVEFRRSDLSQLLQRTWTTRLMSGVSRADQMPGGTSAGTVEQSATATQSYSLSIYASPEVPWHPSHKFGQAEER